MKGQNQHVFRFALFSVSLVTLLLFVFSGILPATATPSNQLTTALANTGLAYIAMSDSDQVALIDTMTHTAVGVINVNSTGCSFPWRVTMSPDSTYVYVSCYTSENVVVIETTNNTIVTTINSLPTASDITFTRDGAYALVGSRFSNQIEVVDTKSMTLTGTIVTPGATRSLASHPSLPQIYVTSNNGDVLIVDTNTFTVVNTIPVGGDPWDIVVSPDGQWVFSGDRTGLGLHVIDPIQEILTTTIPVGSPLVGLAVAPDSSQLYAASLGSDIHVIDIPSLSLGATITATETTWATAVTCDGSELYIGNTSSAVPVINLAAQTIISQIPVAGLSARGIAICPEHITSNPIIYLPFISNNN